MSQMPKLTILSELSGSGLIRIDRFLVSSVVDSNLQLGQYSSPRSDLVSQNMVGRTVAATNDPVARWMQHQPANLYYPFAY